MPSTHPTRKHFNAERQSTSLDELDFLASSRPAIRKYLSFQLWKEGIARYTQIKCAEAATDYHASPEFVELPDYEPFSAYTAHARSDTLEELKRVDLAKWKRVAVYSWGAAEGLFLDRYQPKWKDRYFRSPLTLDEYFAP